MKRNVFFIFSLLFCFKSVAQNTDSIIYVLNFDSVEITIDKYLNGLEKEKSQISYFGYLSRYKGNFRLAISHWIVKDGITDSFLSHLVKNTQRFLLINQRKIPLIFDYDSFFSTPKSTSIGTLGNRDGNILRNSFIFHCYTIIFDGKGKILEIQLE